MRRTIKAIERIGPTIVQAVARPPANAPAESDRQQRRRDELEDARQDEGAPTAQSGEPEEDDGVAAADRDRGLDEAEDDVGQTEEPTKQPCGSCSGHRRTLPSVGSSVNICTTGGLVSRYPGALRSPRVTDFPGVVAPPERTRLRQFAVRDEVSSIVWWVLVGAAAGAIAGFLIGGIGGRLAMLLLRLTSSGLVLGVTSDDGFEIGVISLQSFNLLFAMAALGAMNGVLYAAVRTAIPVRLRLPLWVGFAALVGGSLFVHEDGVDFTLISPVLLAIALFVLLPGVAAALVVLLVERWDREVAWRNRRLTALVIVASLGSTFALVPAAFLAIAALLVRRAGARERLLQVGRIVVPVGLAAIAVIAGIDLAAESSRILP